MADAELNDDAVMRRAEINLSHLQSNLQRLEVDCIELTANAFGHGALEVARAAAAVGISRFVVARSSERAGLEHQISRLGSDVLLGSMAEADRLDAFGLRGGEFTPVMTLSACVVAIKSIRAGEGVSYGYTYRAPRDGWLALVPLGYGDGLLRGLGNRAEATSHGKRYPLAGRVAMDVHSVFTGDEPAQVGDTMTYFGASAGAVSDVAALVGVAAESIPAALGRRVIRTYTS